MLFASVFNAILVFIVGKIWRALENLDPTSAPGNEGVIEPAFAGRCQRSASKPGQTCQRDFMKAIIPFIPLTADLKDGHEESVN